jgi:hypothetical protein
MTNPSTDVVPDLIRVVRDGEGRVQLTIDGVPFPWAISGLEPISVQISNDSTPGVSLTLIAAQVEVVDHQFEPGSFGRNSPRRPATPLEAAAELAPHHPALRWQSGGDNTQHRRALDQDGTVCGLPGPLELADANAPRCERGCWV